MKTKQSVALLVVVITLIGGIIIYDFSGGKKIYADNALGSMSDISGIDEFTSSTKAFYTPFIQGEYLYITMRLNCRSDSKIEFHDSWGLGSEEGFVSSIFGGLFGEAFDDGFPVEIIYSSKEVNNKGGTTEFTVKIPLSRCNTKRPTDIYVKIYFDVAGERKSFISYFDIVW